MSRQPQRRAGLHADRPATAYTIAGFVVIVMSVSMFISFYGLAAVGAWMGLPPVATWTLPVMLDGGIIAYTLSTYLRRAQGRSAAYPWVMVILATLVSAAANGAHVLVAANGAVRPQVAVGAILAGLAPAWAAASAHQVGDLVAPGPAPVRRPATTAAPATTPAPAASTPPATVDLAPTSIRPAPARAQRSSGPDRASLQAEVIRLIADGMSRSQVAATTGVALSTVKRWAAAAPEDVTV